MFSKVLKLSQFDAVGIHYHREISKIEGNQKVTHPVASAYHGNVRFNGTLTFHLTHQEMCASSVRGVPQETRCTSALAENTSLRLGYAYRSGKGFKQFRKVTIPELCAVTNTIQGVFQIIETELPPFIAVYLTIIHAKYVGVFTSRMLSLFSPEIQKTSDITYTPPRRQRH
jgi:hypothetical protein